MFYNCRSLTSLDLSKIDTSNVTNMNGMFMYCQSLTSLDLSKIDTSNVTNMRYMFSYCDLLTTIIGSLDMSSCTNLNCLYMFGSSDNLRGVHLKNVPHSLDLSRSNGIEGKTYIVDNYID